MEDEMVFVKAFYNTQIAEKIESKYGYSFLESLRLFLNSQTYKMLMDPELEMFDFSPLCIFDMWESQLPPP